MHCSLRSLAAALGSIALVSGGSAPAQTVANGPYYATPSWDQTLPASTRFVVLANMNSDAVLDRETGLVWARTAGSPRNLSQAENFCINSPFGGRRGWRVPTSGELLSLFDPTAAPRPFLPAGHPFIGFDTLGQLALWTSTTSLGTTEFLLHGYFSFAGQLSFATTVAKPDYNGGDVLCVRAAN